MVEPGTFLKLFGFLARGTRVLRPAQLRIRGEPQTVRVSGEVAHIRRPAVLDKGWFLWFVHGRRLEVPLPHPLRAGIEAFSTAPDFDALRDEAPNPVVLLDVKQILAKSDRKWRNRDRLQLEIRVPCDTAALLAVLPSSAGDRKVNERGMVTTFLVKKKPEYEDWIVENYEWRKSLDSFPNLEEVTILKNGSSELPARLEVTSVQTESGPIHSAKIAANGGLLNTAGSLGFLNARTREVVLRLSFENPHDTYTITFQDRI